MHTTHVHIHYSSPSGFSQARCAIPSRGCDHPMPSSALLITGMFRALYLTQTRPKASGPSQSFTTWNSQQNISHNTHLKKKKNKRFKETRDEVRGVGRARGGYGNVITIGSAEILVGGDEGNEGWKQRPRVPKHFFFLPCCKFSSHVHTLLSTQQLLTIKGCEK